MISTILKVEMKLEKEMAVKDKSSKNLEGAQEFFRKN